MLDFELLDFVQSLLLLVGGEVVGDGGHCMKLFTFSRDFDVTLTLGSELMLWK